MTSHVVRPSLLATARKSMLAYKHRVDQPYAPTPAMLWGSLVDAVLFDTGLERFKVVASRSTKEAKALKESGALLVTEDEVHSAKECARALRDHPAVAQVLASGEAQFSIQWRDEETGLEMAGRPDWLAPGLGVCFDLKTTSGGLADRDIYSTIHRWGYGIQLAAYRMGLRANGIDLGVGFVFVESDEPYDCRVIELVPEHVDEYEAEVRRLLRRIAKCVETGVWPGVSERVERFAMPHWAFDNQNEVEQEAA